MAVNRSPWRALRPVLLAGAATLTWLTFSASTASADALPDATSLLGGVTNSVSSVTEKLPVPVPVAPAAAPETSTPAPVSSPGLLTPLVGGVSGLADQIVSSVPVVNHVVPAGTVSVIAVPVAQVADAATAEVAAAVIPPVAEALPVLEPVLQPVSGLVTGSAPLPVELPDLPLVSGDKQSHAGAGSVPAGTGAVPGQAVAAAHTPAIPFGEAAEAPATGATLVGGMGIGHASAASWASSAGPDSAQEQPTADPSPAPARAPAVPASGSGSCATSAGSSSAAAWLSQFNFDPATPGALRAGDISEHAPAPVSFDPGSSPD
jgi:hypothetical protein